MKLKINVQIIYPENAPTDDRPYNTRNAADAYEQMIEIEESEVGPRLEDIIKAFNNFNP